MEYNVLTNNVNTNIYEYKFTTKKSSNSNFKIKVNKLGIGVFIIIKNNSLINLKNLGKKNKEKINDIKNLLEILKLDVLIQETCLTNSKSKINYISYKKLNIIKGIIFRIFKKIEQINNHKLLIDNYENDISTSENIRSLSYKHNRSMLISLLYLVIFFILKLIFI